MKGHSHWLASGKSTAGSGNSKYKSADMSKRQAEGQTEELKNGQQRWTARVTGALSHRAGKVNLN